MIICAAIKYKVIRNDINRLDEFIICGTRHGNCWAIWNEMKNNFQKIEEVEGFVDENNTFFNRFEAYKIALANGQISPTTEIYKTEHLENELYSEDLY